MGEFTAQDAIRPRWDPALKTVAIRRFLMISGVLAAMGVVGLVAINVAGVGRHPLAVLLAVVAPFSSAAAAALIAGVIFAHAVIGRIMARMAFPIFVAALVGLVVFAWAFALLFESTDQIVAAQTAAERGVHSYFGGELTRGEIVYHLRGEPPAAEVTTSWMDVPASVLWVLQFRLVRDFILAFGALGFVSLTAGFAIWWERKVAGRIQSRLGPMRVGGWHGWAQSIADGLKLVQKEDIVVSGADRPLFKLAPYMVFIPVLAAFIALPFGAGWVFRDLDVALIFILAMVGIDVVGVILGGWASNNKWSLYGAIRVACQMVSYEVPMGMSLLVPIMTVGALKLTVIGEAQSGGFHTWLVFANPFTFVAALTYFVSALASVKRAPFDLPEAESELVAGFHTEYSGFRWAVFFFGEYAAMFVISGLATVLFLGAWHSPLPASWGAPLLERGLWGRAVHGLLFSGPIWFILKAYLLLYAQIWARWTLPRLRIDQVMYVCIQVLLPATMILLVGNMFWQLLVVQGSGVAMVVNGVLTAMGVLLLLGVASVIAYGYSNRRRLTGSLTVDHLPGS